MDLILLSILTAFIFYRLWTILGTKTGVQIDRRLILNEKESIVILPKNKHRQNDDVATEHENAPLPAHQMRLISGIMEIDATFDPHHFLQGAEAAYQMITKAFVDGDEARLKKFLNQETYDLFSSVIQVRQKEGIHIETNILDFMNVEIDAARLYHNEDNQQIAAITVFFKTKQIMVTYDQEHHTIENEAKTSSVRQDYWTFEKPIPSDSSIWILSKTR